MVTLFWLYVKRQDKMLSWWNNFEWFFFYENFNLRNMTMENDNIADPYTCTVRIMAPKGKSKVLSKIVSPLTKWIDPSFQMFQLCENSVTIRQNCSIFTSSLLQCTFRNCLLKFQYCLLFTNQQLNSYVLYLFLLIYADHAL
jgi:hypothetical protein